MPCLPDEERRVIPDRRERPTGVWSALAGVGRRMRMRRGDEHAGEYFVDRFSATTLVLILALLSLSIVDALITIRLLDADCGEVNPLMAWLLDRGVFTFLLTKYALTAGGLPLLLLYKNFKLFGTRFSVGYLIPLFVALYILLLIYQISLLRTHLADGTDRLRPAMKASRLDEQVFNGRRPDDLRRAIESSLWS